MSTTYASVRDAAIARLQTIADIGSVSAYRRHIVTYEQFQAAFTATVGGDAVLRGWDICLESMQLAPVAWLGSGDQMTMEGQATFVVRGYMGVNDAQATDQTFTALCESVMLALSTTCAALDPRLSHVPVTLRTNTFMVLESAGLGRVLIHQCEIAATVAVDYVS